MGLHIPPEVLNYRHSDAIQGVIESALAPDPDLTVREWADRYRWLSGKSAKEKGKWRSSRVPFMIELMDNLSARSPVMQTIIMKGSQVGGTETGNNWLGYIIDLNPAPTMFVLPTLSVARKVAARLEAMIDADPDKRLRTKVPPPKRGKSGDASNTALLKYFPGGMLVYTGANSPASIASDPIRFIIFDEVDRYPADVGGGDKGEGDVMSVVSARQISFGSTAKTLVISSPGVEQTSLIKPAHDSADRRKYHMPCPYCGGMTKFDRSRMQVETSNRRAVSALALCERCDRAIEERAKDLMLPAGRWIPETLAAEKAVMNEFARGQWGCLDEWNASALIRSYQIGGMYSPLGWLSWRAIAQKAIEAEGNTEKLKTLVTTIDGVPYREVTDIPETQDVYDQHRCEYARGTLPEDVGLLTFGGDVGKDHVELHIWGRGPRETRRLVDYFRFDGGPEDPETWKQVDDVLSREWKHPLGGTLKIERGCIDENYRPELVWQWLQHKPRHLVIGVSGDQYVQDKAFKAGKRDLPLPGGGKRYAGQTYRVGSSYVKGLLYAALAKKRTAEGAEPPGFLGLPKDIPLSWCEQLVAEVPRYETTKRGKLLRVWDKITGRRNEALDGAVYAEVAAISLGADSWPDETWARRFDKLRAAGTAEAATAEAAEAASQIAPLDPGPRPGGLRISLLDRLRPPALDPGNDEAQPGVKRLPMPDYGGFDDN